MQNSNGFFSKVDRSYPFNTIEGFSNSVAESESESESMCQLVYDWLLRLLLPNNAQIVPFWCWTCFTIEIGTFIKSDIPSLIVDSPLCRYISILGTNEAMELVWRRCCGWANNGVVWRRALVCRYCIHIRTWWVCYKCSSNSFVYIVGLGIRGCMHVLIIYTGMHWQNLSPCTSMQSAYLVPYAMSAHAQHEWPNLLKYMAPLPSALQYCPGMTSQDLSHATHSRIIQYTLSISVPQTTSSLRTPIDINSLTDTLWHMLA